MPDQVKPDVKTDPKPKYEPPQIIPLNEIAIGQGQAAPCTNGSSPAGTCSTGGTNVVT